MKVLFAAFVYFITLTAFAKVTVDEFIKLKKEKRSVSQLSYLNLAQESFDHFVGCGRLIEKKDFSLESPAYKCIEENFFSRQSPMAAISYLSWLSTDTKISFLYDCEGEYKSLAKTFTEKPKDVAYCFDAVNESGKSTGLVFFRVKDEKLRILKIKL